MPVLLGVSGEPAPGLRVAGDVVIAERVGAYRVGGRLLLANLLSDAESEVGRDGGGEWPATTVLAANLHGAGAIEFDGRLYAIAAGLLLIEWLVWLRRRA